MTVNWSTASFRARNSSWNADYFHGDFVMNRKLTKPYHTDHSLFLQSPACMWRTIPRTNRPRQSLRHTSGNKGRQNTTTFSETDWIRSAEALTKTIKLPITYETRKKPTLRSHYIYICHQLNYRRPHLFEKFPCSESWCKWKRGSRYAFYQRMVFFTKTHKRLEAQHLLPDPFGDAKKLQVYQFISYSNIDCEKKRDQKFQNVLLLLRAYLVFVGVVGGWDRSYFSCMFKIKPV